MSNILMYHVSIKKKKKKNSICIMHKKISPKEMCMITEFPFSNEKAIIEKRRKKEETGYGTHPITKEIKRTPY